MNIAQLLANAARSKGERGALSVGPRQVATYAMLARHVSGLATSLRTRLDLQPGDRVGIVMTNTPEYIEVLFAVWWAGLIAVPINARLHFREIAYILESADAKACITNKEIEDVVSPLQGKDALKFVISVDGAEYRKLTTRVVDLHPITIAQNARTSGGGNITMVPTRALTVGPVETWRAEKVSIWQAGAHDSPFGMRLTTLMISKRIPDSAVPMSLLADHPNVQFNFLRAGIGECVTEMH